MRGFLSRPRHESLRYRPTILQKCWSSNAVWFGHDGRAGWARRKANAVRHFLRSTYRLTLEHQDPDRSFAKEWALDVSDYVLAGGGFPVCAKNAGIIGSISVSGLAEDRDHIALWMHYVTF
ncbi:heme-binding protein [Sinorhizobium meliloti]|uniref:heme-binding protein n=1 Tax=Rhizobium meliloti TaxID=382 RepID=UPI0031B85C80